MSEDFSRLIAKVKEDQTLQEKFKSAADLDAAIEIAKELGFDISKEDWTRYRESQTQDLTDTELSSVAGGTGSTNGGSTYNKDHPCC